MCHCVPNVIETKKTQTKFSPNSGHNRGGGGQDGKWSHFPPFFFTPSLSPLREQGQEFRQIRDD